MSAASLTISPLNVASDLAATIAARQFALWGPLTGYGSVAEYESFLRGTADRKNGLPAVLVASRDGAFVGSVNLLANEIADRPALSPWLAQLFVLDASRGRGAGSALAAAAIAHAGELGFCRLYLYTSGTLPAYYAARGWRPVEQLDYLGKMRTIMVFDLP